jgi:hypothetical protein
MHRTGNTAILHIERLQQFTGITPAASARPWVGAPIDDDGRPRMVATLPEPLVWQDAA